MSSARELYFLGTSSQVPTRYRGHNSLFLRWDDLGILMDPGEGTQRQMIMAGLSVSQITHVLITHFHGDHCLGLAGIFQRISLDAVSHPIEVTYPKSGQCFLDALRRASIYRDRGNIVYNGITPARVRAGASMWTRGAMSLHALPLDHRGVDCFGYRLVEASGRTMLPEKLEAAGIRGPAIGKLQREGSLMVGDRLVHVDDFSLPRVGQVFSLVMDTRPCANMTKLAHGADLLVSESTYLSSETVDAWDHGHMTAEQAAKNAREAVVRRLALTHFSQRYMDLGLFEKEAAAVYAGDLVVAQDLAVVSVPPRL